MATSPSPESSLFSSSLTRASPRFLQPVWTGELELQTDMVAIQIVDVTLREEKLQNYVTYTIRVRDMQGSDMSGTFEVLRRYHDFVDIRRTLSQLWPGVFIPPVPPKKMLVSSRQGNTKSSLVETRRVVLEEFLKKTVSDRLLLNSYEFQDFIKHPGEYAKLQSVEGFSSETVARCQGAFSAFSRECTSETMDRLALGLKFLTQARETMRQVRKSAKTSTSLYSSLASTHISLAESAQKYERVSLSQSRNLAEVPIFKSADPDLRCNPFQLIQDWAKIEELDLKAMIEACRMPQEIEAMKTKLEGKLDSESSSLQKLQEGRASLSQFFSRKSKSDHKTDTENRVAQVRTIGSMNGNWRKPLPYFPWSATAWRSMKCPDSKKRKRSSTLS